jgi:RNA polymerase sigma-70 factor (ECF subfamily)
VQLTQNQIEGILKRISRHDDEKALKELFDAFYGKLCEAAKFYLDDHSVVQEVVSDVFIKLWNGRTKIESIGNIGAYLFVATKRQSLNYIRDNKKRNHQSLNEISISTYIESRSPESILLSDEFNEILQRAICDLPSKCRLVYSMVKDDGMKYQEVADILDVSVKTVEMHVGKALRRIKLAFDNYKK